MIKLHFAVKPFQLPFQLRVVLVIFAFVGHSAANAQVFLNASDVITASDYPQNSWDRADQGVTEFKLNLSSNGRPSACSVEKSSGYEELDAAVCSLMLQRAMFDMSSVSSMSPSPTYSNRVRWSIPITPPRALVFGVTVKSLPVPSDLAKTKCEYSDKEWRIVAAGTPCARPLPKLVLKKNGTTIRSNIFEQYIIEADKNENAEAAFNLAILLIENNYKQGVRYMEKASALGNPLASASLCNFYSEKEYSRLKLVDFNPNQAVEYCILSYKQSYNYPAVTNFNNIVIKYGSQLNKDVLDRAKAIIKFKPQTAYARRLTAGSDIVGPNDYPKRDNANQVGGVTVAVYGVTQTGKVGTCLIAQSTYSYSLDQKACTRLKDVAIFSPAVIEGKPAVQWLSQKITWNPGARNKPSAGGVIMQILLGALGAAI